MPRRFYLPIITILLVAASSAFGQNWEWQYPRPTGNTLYDVTFADSLHGLAVGAVGTILRTTDGGQHWESAPSGYPDDLRTVSFPDARHGWIAGGGGG